MAVLISHNVMNYKYYKIIIAITVVLLGLGVFGFVRHFDKQSLGDDALQLPEGLIYFTYTDDNSGENLIIKSDKKNYETICLTSVLPSNIIDI